MNVCEFLSRLRDKLPGENRIVSAFLMENEFRIRVDLEFQHVHLTYVIAKTVQEFSLVNEYNVELYIEVFGEEINGKIAEWEVGEK